MAIAPPTSARVSSSFGDIRISHFAAVKTNLRHLNNFEITGDHIVVETVNPSRPLRFYLVVRGVIGQSVGPKGQYVDADFKGPVQFRVVRQEGSERRVLEGTAGHAHYNEPSRQLVLSQGISAALTDPVRLEGPATLHVEKAIVATDKSGHIALQGPADSDSLAFVPKIEPPKGQTLRHKLGAVQVRGFTSAYVDLPTTLQVEGSPVSMAFSDTVTHAQGTLSARLMKAQFQQNRLANLEGTEGVQFHITQPDSQNQTILLEGQADAGLYNTQRSLLVLQNVQGSLQIPQKLQGPALLHLARLEAHFGKTPSYRFLGGPSRDTLTFAPKPSVLSATPNQPARPISLGVITVEGFQEGTYVPGKRFLLRGKDLAILTADSESGLRSRIQSELMEGALSSTNEVLRLSTQGPVHCYFERPYHPAESSPQQAGPVQNTKETIEATAASLFYINDAQGAQVTMQGPAQITALSPALAGPARYIGAMGDTMTWNLRTDDLVMDSPQGTARLEAVVPSSNQPTNLKPTKGKKP